MATSPPSIRYNFEYERKLRVCFIGAGGHSFRNVYPAFQYAPVDLLAVCDVNGERASAYARQVGARTHYTDHREMLARERPDAVFIVTSYHPDGRVQATDLALDALAAGASGSSPPTPTAKNCSTSSRASATTSSETRGSI